jgi:hypothetical protein
MGDRSGTGLVELAVLEAVDTLVAGRPRAFIRSAKVLALLEENIGLGPRYGYGILVDLARPWTIPVRLISPQGNFGDRIFPAAGAGYTECRVTHAGQVVLGAEAHRLAPVPVGLINGTTYRGGIRPPLEPFRVITALRRLMEEPGLPDGELVSIVGPPDFVTGCAVTGDLAALARGRPTPLRLTAQMTLTDEHHLIVDSLPPSDVADRVIQTIADRASRRQWADSFPSLGRDTTLPVAEVRDVSTWHDHEVRMALVLQPDADPDTVKERLAGIEGVVTELRAAFPAPLARLLRSWVDSYRGEDIAASLTELETAIRRDRQRESRNR